MQGIGLDEFFDLTSDLGKDLRLRVGAMEPLHRQLYNDGNIRLIL